MSSSLKTLLGVVTMATLCCSNPTAVRSQSIRFSTFAGNAGYGSVDGFTNYARFNFPHGMAVDEEGNIYVADTQNSAIRKIDATHFVSTLAGLAGSPGKSDGSTSIARFNNPQGIAVDAAGNIYVADTGNNLIRQITPSGVTTLAGSAGVTGSTNGTGTNALFRLPGALVVDASTNVFVADTYNSTIRKVTFSGSNWVVTTIAGVPGTNANADGSTTNAFFFQPSGITIDSNQNLYVADTGNGAIRKIRFNGTNWVTSTIAHLPLPLDICSYSGTRLYVTCADDTIRRVEFSGTNWTVDILAGVSGVAGDTDGGSGARFDYPSGLTIHDGAIYVADSLNNTVRSVKTNGIVASLAGLAGGKGFVDGGMTDARFNQPTGLATDSDNNLYVADSKNGTIRQITPSGLVTTLAGVATNSPGNQNGIGTNAAFNFPAALAVGANKQIYLADRDNNEIRVLSAVSNHWAATTLAGRAGPVFIGDITNIVGGQTFVSTVTFASSVYRNFSGALTNISGGVTNVTAVITNIPFLTNVVAGHIQTNFLATNFFNLPPAPQRLDGSDTNALFNHPSGLALDQNGNLYVADGGTNGVRLVTPAGFVSTPAGFSGAYPVGTNQLLFHSSALAIDPGGNVFVADAVNNTIRELPLNGSMITIAGVPGISGTTDGTNNLARFSAPSALILDSATNLYVTDASSHTIRKISPSGTDWIVTTIGGWPNLPGFADGLGKNARFNSPQGIAINANGTFYISDSANNIIRIGQVDSGAPVTLQFGRDQQQGIVLFWPASATGFQLESSTNLDSSAAWVPVANTPAPSDTNLVVTNVPTAGAMYFRLRQL
jgi:sugar lactone lactonase YvrE